MKSHLDMSGLKALEKKLKDLSNKQVEFGYPEGSGQHSDAKMSYAELATILEWGARNENGMIYGDGPCHCGCGCYGKCCR